MRNLYEILGLEKTASAEEVKEAYRRAVKAVHPDKGGNADAFREVQTAFTVLSDADSRRVYDESGDAEQAATGRSQIETILASVFAAAIRKHVGKGAAFILASVKEHVRECIDAKRDEIGAANRQRSKLETLAGKIERTTGGANIVEAALSGLIAEQRRIAEACESDIAQGDEMLAYLRGYRAEGPRELESGRVATGRRAGFWNTSLGEPWDGYR